MREVTNRLLPFRKKLIKHELRKLPKNKKDYNHKIVVKTYFHNSRWKVTLKETTTQNGPSKQGWSINVKIKGYNTGKASKHILLSL